MIGYRSIENDPDTPDILLASVELEDRFTSTLMKVAGKILQTVGDEQRQWGDVHAQIASLQQLQNVQSSGSLNQHVPFFCERSKEECMHIFAHIHNGPEIRGTSLDSSRSHNVQQICAKLSTYATHTLQDRMSCRVRNVLSEIGVANRPAADSGEGNDWKYCMDKIEGVLKEKYPPWEIELKLDTLANWLQYKDVVSDDAGFLLTSRAATKLLLLGVQYHPTLSSKTLGRIRATCMQAFRQLEGAEHKQRQDCLKHTRIRSLKFKNSINTGCMKSQLAAWKAWCQKYAVAQKMPIARPRKSDREVHLSCLSQFAQITAANFSSILNTVYEQCHYPFSIHQEEDQDVPALVPERSLWAYHIESFVQALSAVALHDQFWDQVSGDDPMQSLTKLATLTAVYAQLILHPEAQALQELNVALALFIFQLALARKIDPELQRYRIHISLPVDPPIPCGDIAVTEHYRTMRSYLDTINVSTSSAALFDFSAYPSYVSSTESLRNFPEIKYLADWMHKQPAGNTLTRALDATLKDRCEFKSALDWPNALLLAIPVDILPYVPLPYRALREAAFLTQLFLGSISIPAEYPQKSNPTFTMRLGKMTGERLGVDMEFWFGDVTVTCAETIRKRPLLTEALDITQGSARCLGALNHIAEYAPATVLDDTVLEGYLRDWMYLSNTYVDRKYKASGLWYKARHSMYSVFATFVAQGSKYADKQDETLNSVCKFLAQTLQPEDWPRLPTSWRKTECLRYQGSVDGQDNRDSLGECVFYMDLLHGSVHSITKEPATGHVVEHKRILYGQGEDVYRFPNYVSLFERENKTLSRDNGWYFSEISGKKICIAHEDNYIFLQKHGGTIISEIQKVVCRYIPIRTLPTCEGATEFLPAPLIANHTHWTPYTGNDTNMRIVPRTLSPNEDVSGFTLDAQGIASYQGGHPGASRIHILWKKTAAAFLTDLFSGFEAPEWILVESDGTKATTLRFPRCCSIEDVPLAFYCSKDDKNTKWRWGGGPSYVLSSHSRLQGPRSFCRQHMLYLYDKKKNHAKVLVLVQPLKQDMKYDREISLDRRYPFTRGDLKKEIFPYLEYNVDGDTLVPLNHEGMAYLAYLQLHQRHYSDAYRSLHAISYGIPLSSVSCRILHFIAFHKGGKQDVSPLAIAVRLLAALYIAGQDDPTGYGGERQHVWACARATVAQWYAIYAKGVQYVEGSMRLNEDMLAQLAHHYTFEHATKGAEPRADRRELADITRQMCYRDTLADHVSVSVKYEALTAWHQWEVDMGKRENLKALRKQIQEEERRQDAIASLLDVFANLNTAGVEGIDQDMLKKGKYLTLLELDQLLQLFLHAEPKRYVAANPSLSTEQIQQLHNLISCYLVVATRCQAAKRALACMDTATRIQNDHVLVQRELATDLSYYPCEYPELLVYEYRENVRIYPDTSQGKMMKKQEKLNPEERCEYLKTMLLNKTNSALAAVLLWKYTSDFRSLVPLSHSMPKWVRPLAKHAKRYFGIDLLLPRSV